MAFIDINLVPDIALRKDRPPIILSHGVRIVVSWLRPLILPYLRRSYGRAEERLGELIEAASQCKSRKELEMVLDCPAYALVGDGLGAENLDGSMSSPDRIESYVRDRVVIDLWFRDNNAYAISGFVKWSRWDLATNLADELTRRSTLTCSD